PSYFNDGSFLFLNLRKNYSDINWNDMSEGKLWCYNLNYFDFLDSPDVSVQKGLEFINDFIDKLNSQSKGLESYPISIRGINWIKFFSNNKITPDKKVTDSLISQYDYLFSNIEYHILGNHLLENGFSLLFAAAFFNNKKYYKKALLIIRKELDEQILEDGAHFELSPMYHQIVLFRILDSINML
ncbi:hypothetical protein E3E36_11265, partial [Thermococcus sp. M36]|uniref:heparinase II/III family protein n=1 Tax=Thermococcus sp. M36 TaxID=1638261 RepID=UPI0016A85901